MERTHTQPTVAVVIPTYNRARLLIQTLDSILNQTRPADEIVVIDDGSTDATAAVVAEYGESVRYMRQANAGKATALNRALKTVNSDYIWFMDDDDVALPHAIEAHLAFLDTRPEIDFSYSSYCAFIGEGPPTREVVSAPGTLPTMDAPPDELFSRALMDFPFYLQGALVPLECYRRVGPFDEALAFTEDYEMILRIARHFRGGRVPERTFWLRVHMGLRGPAQERLRFRQRTAAFRRYQRVFFSRLYHSLSLDEYLPGGPAHVLKRGQEWQARLQRACVMSRQGLFDKAFEDLRLVLSESREGADLKTEDLRIFSQLLNVEAWWLRVYPDFTTTIGRLLRQRGALAALDACAVGLAWRLERSVRNGQFAGAMRIGNQLRKLIGTRGLPVFFNTAVKRRYQRREAL